MSFDAFGRNMTLHPYSDDEKRIVNWIWEISGGDVGGGADPIGFFIASYESLIHERKEANRTIAALTLDRDRLFTLCQQQREDLTESPHPDGRDLVEDSLDITREYVRRGQNAQAAVNKILKK
jgi:hypothetical protein